MTYAEKVEEFERYWAFRYPESHFANHPEGTRQFVQTFVFDAWLHFYKDNPLDDKQSDLFEGDENE